ncbi:MAG: SLC13 family permease [Ignavibacterium sp.]
MAKKIGFYGGLLFAIIILLFFDFDPTNPKVTRMTAVAILMAFWWVSEAIPLAATSLIPLILFPTLGIYNGEGTASTYFNSTISLFLGGMIIAIAMEQWNLHKRISLKIILMMGTNQSRIVLGFLIASAFISMWISNTATAVMMLPIGLAIITELEQEFSKEKIRNFTISILISIAYGSTIGGMMTLVGTPPNLSFVRILHIIFPEAPDISFGKWLQLSLPIGLILVLVTWILLTKFVFKPNKEVLINKDVIKNEYNNLGKISFEEKIVGLIFLLTAILWIFRIDLELGFITIPGWSKIFKNANFINDGTVAIAMSTILFLIPAKSKIKSKRILSADVFKKIPWDVILLFGGGFALAKGFIESGLSDFIGHLFINFKSISPILLMFIMSLFVKILTEFTSNTATAEMILPIAASISVALNINPLLLMLTVTFAASLGFMFPSATPPNAVIFGSQRIKIFDLVKAGFFLSIFSILLTVLIIYFLGIVLFGINLGILPDWVK